MRVNIDPAAPLGSQLREHGLWQHLPAYPKPVAIVYRWRSVGDELLYIGTTVNPPIRWQKHKAHASWWSLVTCVDVEFYDHPGLATNIERKAIQSEHPRFNIRSSRRSESGAAPERLANVDGAIPGGKGMEEEWKRKNLKVHPSVTDTATPTPPVLRAASAGDGWLGGTR